MRWLCLQSYPNCSAATVSSWFTWPLLPNELGVRARSRGSSQAEESVLMAKAMATAMMGRTRAQKMWVQLPSPPPFGPSPISRVTGIQQGTYLIHGSLDIFNWKSLSHFSLCLINKVHSIYSYLRAVSCYRFQTAEISHNKMWWYMLKWLPLVVSHCISSSIVFIHCLFLSSHLFACHWSIQHC